jgi:hypothetical protein
MLLVAGSTFFVERVQKRVGFCSMTILNDRKRIEEVTEGSVSFMSENEMAFEGYRRSSTCRVIGPRVSCAGRCGYER